jgi:hypothetical protein
MTSFAPLTERVLRTLRDAERGSFSRLDAAAQHDLAYARSLSAGERLGALNEIMLLAEAFGLPALARRKAGIRVVRL